MRIPAVIAFGVSAAACQAGMTGNPQASALNMELGAAYLDQGRLELAHDKLVRAARQNSGSSEAHRLLGLVYERLDDLDRAEEHLAQAVKLAPHDVEALNSLGVFHCRRDGEAEQGLKLLLRAAREAGAARRAAVYANCGLCELTQDRTRAVQWFRRALELDPRNAQAQFFLKRLRTQD